MERPNITDIKTGNEIKQWYWLKQELVEFCRLKKVSYTGSKFEILDRIVAFLDNGNSKSEKQLRIHKPASKFNWAKSTLSLNTVITDSYTNGVNTRSFFKQHCGEKFHFSIPFMEYMKNNCGKTLQDAIKEWHRLNDLTKVTNYKSQIPTGNQYNQYIRDFFADNPESTIAEARHFWKLKRSLPLGRHIYEKSDLELIDR
jgi:hypothetical protein